MNIAIKRVHTDRVIHCHRLKNEEFIKFKVCILKAAKQASSEAYK